MNIDLEKIMEGLEHCSNRTTCDSSCPYWYLMDDPNMGIDECTSQLACDALSLIKAQEPRVMTLEEAISDYIGVVYYESIYSSIVLAGYVDSIRNGRCEIATIGSEETEKEMLSDYGIKWRFWTSYPTNEQRKAVKWDGKTETCQT